MTLQELYERPTISIAEAAGVLSVSTAHAYEMAKRGDLPVIQVGPNRRVVVTHQLIAQFGLDPSPRESADGRSLHAV